MPSPKRRKGYRVVGCHIQISRLGVVNCCLCSKLNFLFSLTIVGLVYVQSVKMTVACQLELVRKVLIYLMLDCFHDLESLGEKHKGKIKELLQHLCVQPAKD